MSYENSHLTKILRFCLKSYDCLRALANITIFVNMAEFVALFDDNEQKRRRQRVFRERVDILEQFRDDEIIARYRLSREAIVYLNESLRVDLEPKTNRSNSLSSLTQVIHVNQCLLHCNQVNCKESSYD